MAGAWFDLYEFVFLSYERGVLSDEQLRVWKTGVCNLPPSFFDAYGEQIPDEMFLDSLVSAVKECNSRPLTGIATIQYKEQKFSGLAFPPSGMECGLS